MKLCAYTSPDGMYCGRSVMAKGLCNTHYRQQKMGKPLSPIQANGAWQVNRVGALNPHWKGDQVSYEGAHKRVHKVRGAAIEYRCQGEGCDKWAEHWAHDNQSPLSDVSAYRPLCRWCHAAFDGELRPRGANHGKSKLTENSVRNIRALAAAGCPRKELALVYGISASNIGHIVRRHTWAHVA